MRHIDITIKTKEDHFRASNENTTSMSSHQVHQDDSNNQEHSEKDDGKESSGVIITASLERPMSESVLKFAFIVHPLAVLFIKKHPLCKRLQFLPDALIEQSVSK